MKINSVYINDLLDINNQEIAFPEPAIDYFGNLKLSIIVGENGTCKTSLLKFLAESFLYPKINSKNNKYYKNGFKVNYQIQGQDTSIEAKHPSYESSMSKNETTEPNLMPTNIIVSTTALNGKFSSNSREINNIKYIYTGPLKTERLTIVKALSNPDLEIYIKILLKLIGYTKEYRIVMPEAEIVVNMMDKYKRKLEFMKEEELAEFLRIHTIIGVSHDKSKRRKAIYPNDINNLWISTIEKMMEAGVNLDFQLEIKNPTNNKWINLKEMSSGEQAMFDRCFSLLMLIKNNSLVLIDEPETHLHPNWIKQYVLMLSKLFSRFHAHIIIATHSPLIAADVPNECIVGLVKSKETGLIQQYHINKETLGGSPASILNNVFNLDTQMISFSDSIIKRIKEYVSTGEFEKAMNMFNDLGITVDKYSLYNELQKHIPEEFK